MSIYVLITYVDECKSVGVEPTASGLKEYKNTWED